MSRFQEVYLVLKNSSATGGVSGIEAALTLPSDCLYEGADFGSQFINIANPPEFIVGFSDPIPYASAMVIATFSLVFFSPGEVILHAPQQNVAAGIMGARYSSPLGQGELFGTSYSFGSPLHPALTICQASCPEVIIQQVPDGFGAPDYLIIEPGDIPEMVSRTFVHETSASEKVIPDGVD